MRLKLAIVGRPNVGKSTLFNRLAGRRLAIVDDRPGVTRDRREVEADYQGMPLILVDTAGYEDVFDGRLESRMREQTERAIGDADIILFVIDGRAGVTALDRQFADVLRKTGRPVILCVNKSEGREAEAGRLESYRLGFGEPVAVSAEHGLGLDVLVEELREFWYARRDAQPTEDAPPAEEPPEGRPSRPLQIAIIGRPNVGKSTLINALIGEERLLTGPEAGITRDSIAVPLSYGGRDLLIYDTAGLRRRAKIEDRLEKLSVGDTINAIRFADVVVLVMDAIEAYDKQDLQLADLIEREGRAAVLAYSKWDLIEDTGTARKALHERAEKFLPQLRGIAEVPVSGETGRGLNRLMQAIFAAADVWNKRVGTSGLNRWLEGALERHPPPAAKGRRIKIRYMTQAKARPPTFIVFCQRAEELPDDYTRYLVQGIREKFGFPGTPIRLHLRAGKNPYAKS